MSTVVPSSYAQGLALSVPGKAIGLSSSYELCLLRGLKFDPKFPFRFQFMLDEGDSGLSADAMKDESDELVKFFLASLTISEKDMWVNLSPYESNRIVSNDFGRTTMGRELLAQDYVLKQLTASLLNPDSVSGKKFWDEVYRKTADKYGTTDIPLDTFNKVWVVPSKAVIYEGRDGVSGALTAFIEDASLKVMLEADYLAESNNVVGEGLVPALGLGRPQGSPLHDELAKDIIREIIVPALEKEVNEGKGFSRLRQVYHSLLLAVWLKKKIMAANVNEKSPEKKAGILSMIYLDKNKTAGLETRDPQGEVKGIYDLYVQAFHKGAYDHVREEVDQYSAETLPRKYFSGGMTMAGVDGVIESRSGQPSRACRAQIVDVLLKGIKGTVSLAFRLSLVTMISGSLVFQSSLAEAKSKVIPAKVSVKRVVVGKKAKVTVKGKKVEVKKPSNSLKPVESTDPDSPEAQMMRKIFENAGGIKAHLDGLGRAVPFTAEEVAAKMKMSPGLFYKIVKTDYEDFRSKFEMAGLSFEDVIAYILATACIETAYLTGEKSSNGLYYGFGQFGRETFERVKKFDPSLKGVLFSHLLTKPEVSVRVITAYLAMVAEWAKDKTPDLVKYDKSKGSRSILQKANTDEVMVLLIKCAWGIGEDKSISTYWEFIKSAEKNWNGWKGGILTNLIARFKFAFKGFKEALEKVKFLMSKNEVDKVFITAPQGSKENAQISGEASDQAELTPGGIDLQTDKMDKILRGQANSIDVDLTPAQVEMLKQGIAGFVPVILDVVPAGDYRILWGFSNDPLQAGH